LTATEQAVPSTRILGHATQYSETSNSGWASSHVRRLTVTDAAVIVTTVAITWLARFGIDPATFRPKSLVYSYAAVSAALILACDIRLRSGESRVGVSTGVEGAKLRAVWLRLKRLEFAGRFGRPTLRRTFLLAVLGDR
jgi:hypothetical protein